MGVGETDDSVGVEIVESETVGSKSDNGRIGDGPGMDIAEDSSELSSTVDGVGTGGTSGVGVTLKLSWLESNNILIPGLILTYSFVPPISLD